jgi:hypothetical protein
MRAHSSISDLSPISRKMWLVELCSDLVQQDADIFRLGTDGRQGENFLQFPAKMRAHRRFPKRPDLGFFELALFRRQGAAVKTKILRHQFHLVWFANTGAKAPPLRFRAVQAVPRYLPLLRLKLPTQDFVPTPHATPHTPKAYRGAGDEQP